MSKVGRLKIFDKESKKWVTVSSLKASEILVTDENFIEVDEKGNKEQPNVEKVLGDMKESINLAQSNIAWLALHGGGGASGGSGGGSGGGGSADGYITVNSIKSETGSVTLGDNGLYIELRTSGSSGWVITATSGRTTIKYTGDSKTLSISNNELESKGLTKTFPLSITAYHSESLTTLYWDGTVVINTVTISCNTPIDIDFNNIQNLNLTYQCTVGVEGQYVLRINGEQIGDPFEVSSYGTSHTIPMSEIGLTAGSNTINARLESVLDPSTYGEFTSSIVCQAGNPIIFSSALSEDSTTPTEIELYGSTISIGLPFIVYYAKNNSTFKYSICIGDDKPDWNGSYYQYNTTIGTAAYYMSNAKVGENIKCTIYIRDTNTSTGDDNSGIYSKSYYVLLTEPSSKELNEDEVVIQKTIFDFSSSNGYIINKVWADNEHKHTNTSSVYKDQPYTINIQQVNTYSNSIQPNTSTVGPYLRLQNASYGIIPMCKEDIETWNVGNNVSFTIELCFHADYHPDDDRIIFQWGNLQNKDILGYVTSTGIVVRAHDVYVNGAKILSLEDNEDIHLIFTYSSAGGTGTLITYLDGVIESVASVTTNELLPWISGSSNSNCSMYVGAGSYVDEVIDYTDVNIFHIKLLNYCMNPYQVLTAYLNDQSRTIYVNGVRNMNLITEGKRRNFIDNEGSILYNTNATWDQSDSDNDLSNVFSLSNFIQTVGTTNHLSSKIRDYTIPIPILFLDVSSEAVWTWDNFIKPQSQSSALTSTEATFEYYDQKLNEGLIIGSETSTTQAWTVTVEPQGTSTLADYIKNLNITFPDDITFIPKESWFPEQTYTLKADIVDSSHSLNTSIGKFVNEELGLDEHQNTKWYPYSKTVLDSFKEQKENQSSAIQKYFPNATLKHGVEGFPVFLIMKFAVPSGSNDTGVHTLGIYQFILGRKSPRNLGYEIITSVTGADGTSIDPKSMTYPFISRNFTVKTTSNQGIWAEFVENNSWGVSFNFQEAGENDFKNSAMTGAFWQPVSNAGDYYNQNVEIKYQNIGSNPTITSFVPFTNFVNAVTKLPVNYQRYSAPNNGFTHSDFRGSYDGYSYVKNSDGQYIWEKGGDSISSAGRGDGISGVCNDNINVECIAKYQALCMFWGLMDNFQKNMPLKFYQDSADSTGKTYEKALLGIYDTDTGCGQTNQATTVNNEYLWFTGLKNTNSMCLTECPSSLGINKSSTGGTIIADNNKLWTIDTDDLQYSVYGETKKNCSIFANMWHSLRKLKPNIVDDFYNNYFLPQTEGCGELLFNLTYIAKYINKYQTSDSSSKSNQITKLHGRRRYQVKRWLEKRVKFLDSMYDAMGIGSTMGGQGYAVETVSINAVISPSMTIKTNSPIIIHYNNQGSDDRYVICDRNIPTDIYMGAPELTSDPDKSHLISNPLSIIQLGNGNHPLYDIGFSTINVGSFPYLIEYNVSTPNRSDTNLNVLKTMDSNYMSSHFVKNNISELRTIDFSNTYPYQPDLEYSLNLATGFKKLQNLYINNSCITNVTFPTDVSLRDINIVGSNLKTLTLENQGFISELDLSNCSLLSNLQINNCDNLKNIVVDNTNTSLQVVNISSDGLEEFKATDNNILTDISVTSSSLKSIYISNCPKLTTLNICIDNISEIYINNCQLLETIEFNSQQEGVSSFDNLTSFKVITCPKFKGTYFGSNDVLQAVDTPFADDTYASIQIVDISRFPNLTTVSFYGDSSIEYVQFKNDKEIPFVLANVDGKSPFSSCTSLTRIFGNIQCTNGAIFRGNKKFSIHGYDCAKVIWKGNSVVDSNGRVKIPAEVCGGITAEESTSKDSKQGTENSTITKVKTFNSNSTNFYQDGLRVTNIIATTGNSLFFGTSCTLFDMYYFFAHIDDNCVDCSYTFGSNNTQTAWGNDYVKYAQFKMNTSTTTPDNSPNRYMFVSCGKIKSLAFCWYGCSSNGFRIFTPSTTSDGTIGNDGLFSPLVSCTLMNQIFYSMTYITDNKVFRKSSGSYVLTNINYFKPRRIVGDVNTLDTYSNKSDISSDGDLSGFFENLTKLTTCVSLFDDLLFVNFDLTRNNGGFKIPSNVITLTSFLKASTGKGTMLTKGGSIGTEYFASPAKVINIYQSFRIENNTNGNVNLYISNNFFSEFKSLQRVGYITTGSSTGSCLTASFGGGGITKIIEGNVFPESIISNLSNIIQFSGFFANAQFESDPSENILLPSNLFRNNPNLTDCSGIFYSVNFDYKLSETNITQKNNFVNCTKLQYVDYAFARGGINTSLSKGLKGCYIPNKFFYHGMNVTKTSLYGTNKTWTETITLDDNHKIEGNNYIVKTETSKINDNNISGYILSSVIGSVASTDGYYYLTKSTNVYSNNSMTGDPIAILQSNSVVKGKSSESITYITTATEIITTKTDTYIDVSPKDNNEETVIITRLPSTVINTNIVNISSDGNTTTNTTSDYYGNIMLPDTESKSTASYYVYTPNKTIKSMCGCFQGADLSHYNHSTISLDDVEDYYKFSPFDYSYDSNTNMWSDNKSNKCTLLHTYMWVYDGNPLNSLPKLSELNNKNNVSDYNPSYDVYGGVDSWHHIDEIHYGVNNFKSDHPYSGISSTINYCCSPDLLRYCTQDCLISYLFSNSGVEYSSGGPGWSSIYNAGGESITSWGIEGRIPPYLLLPVPNIKNIEHMFYCCRRLSSYTNTTTNKSYIIPEHFFQYATNVTNMSYAFAGTFMPSSIDLDVFKDISNGVTLNLNHTFWRTCYGDGAIIQNCFTSKNVSNINYCFARIASDEDIIGPMNFPIYAMDSGKVTFKNIFNKTYKNNQWGTDMTKSYVFAGFDSAGVNHEDPTTLVNNTTTKNYVYKGNSYPETV